MTWTQAAAVFSKTYCKQVFKQVDRTNTAPSDQQRGVFQKRFCMLICLVCISRKLLISSVKARTNLNVMYCPISFFVFYWFMIPLHSRETTSVLTRLVCISHTRISTLGRKQDHTLHSCDLVEIVKVALLENQTCKWWESGVLSLFMPILCK